MVVRSRKTHEHCKVLFLGGPRHGNYRDYPYDPVTVGCVTEAHEKKMHGLYRTTDFKDGVVTMQWKDMPLKRGTK